jgi:hypothetical protein
MTLKSDSEIRDTCRLHIGYDEKVERFVAAFIQHKAFDSEKVVVRPKKDGASSGAASAPAAAATAAASAAASSGSGDRRRKKK